MTASAEVTDEAYEDLKLALEWGTKLQLTDLQCSSLQSLCARIGGGSDRQSDGEPRNNG